MFILPLPGDKLELSDGSEPSVLAFSPQSQKPTILVDDGVGDPKPVLISDIARINGVKVVTMRGSILSTPGMFDRKVHLPQQDDSVTVLNNGMTYSFRLRSLSLDRNGGSHSLSVAGVLDTGEKIKVPAASMLSLERASGNKTFSVRSFQSVYSDYLGEK